MRSSVGLSVGLVLLVDIEVLILLEGRVQGEHHMQRLHLRVRKALVNWDVEDVAGHLAVVRKRQVDLFARGCHLGQGLFDSCRPFLHERVDIGHWLGVADRWWLFGLVDVSDRADPGQDLFGVLLCAFNSMHLAVLASSVLLVVVDQLQVDLCLIRLIERWLVLHNLSLTSTYSPKVSGCPSGLGIFKNAST